MTRIRSITLTSIAALALAAGGCDDGTSPIDLEGLDPAGIVSAVNALSAPMQGPREALDNLFGNASEALAAAGVDIGASTVEFPDEVTGSTFVFDQADQAWVIDESQTGAPTDGVRVMWYPLDSTNRIIDATESGYIDIHPADVPGNAPITIRVVEFGGGPALLDITRDHSRTVNGDPVESSEAEGSYSNGERVVSFSIELTNTMSTATGDVDYSYTSIMEDAETRYVVTSDGVTDGTTGGYDDTITATIERGGSTTVVEVRFRGTGDTHQNVDGFVRHNGTTVALVDLRGGAYAFTGPNGEDVSAAQANELNALFSTVTLRGLLLYEYELRRFFPTEN